MADTNDATPPAAKGFPCVTVAASLATFFAFLGLTLLAYHSPNYLTETKDEPKPDPAVKLGEVKAKNQALLDGNGAKMSMSAATLTAARAPVRLANCTSMNQTAFHHVNHWKTPSAPVDVAET